MKSTNRSLGRRRRRRLSMTNAIARSGVAARSALVLARESGSDGGGAYRLLGSLTAASQLTSEMLAETRRTSKR